MPADTKDGFVTHSFAADAPQDCNEYVRSKLQANGLNRPRNPQFGRKLKHCYPYVDETEQLLFQVVRYEPKGFAQRRPDGGGGWIWDLKNVRRVLYRLPELIEALSLEKSVFIVEGEKDVDALWALGVPATCSPQGAGKWQEEFSALLRDFPDAETFVVPDNDEPGQTHAQQICASLLRTGMNARLVQLPGLPEHGDISTWLASGGTVDALYEIAERSPIYAATDPNQEPSLEPNTSESEALKVEACPYRWPDAASIPPRQFLFGRHYIRKVIGATIAAGGRAKTTLGALEAVSMTCGRNLLTNEPMTTLRVWYLNGEEDQDELDRRFTAICQRYGITEADCGGRLFVQSVRDKPIRLGSLLKSTPTLNRSALDQIETEIRAKQIDVLMLDPLVSFHSLNENDNGQMDLLLKEGLGGIASRTNCAGEIFHHSGKAKPGQAETIVEDARGASAILWAVRGARVLNFMTPDEAEKLGIGEDARRFHVRITNGKANMGPLGKATWFKLAVENLPNGDEVACASPWNPPDPFRGVTPADMHKCRTLAQTGAYRLDSRSSDWIGYAVAKTLGIGIAYGAENDPKDLARIKQILQTWFKNNVLATEKRRDSSRKERIFVVPGSWRPENIDPEEFTLQ
jgi:hypothetical protein